MKGRIRQELERDAARTGILLAGSVSRFGMMRTTNPSSNATVPAKGSGRAVSSPHRAGESRVVWNFCRGVLVRGSRCPRSGGHAPRGTHTTCALDEALSGHRFFFCRAVGRFPGGDSSGDPTTFCLRGRSSARGFEQKACVDRTASMELGSSRGARASRVGGGTRDSAPPDAEQYCNNRWNQGRNVP